MNENTKKIGLGALAVVAIGVIAFEAWGFFTPQQMNIEKGPSGTPGHGMGAMMRQLGKKGAGAGGQKAPSLAGPLPGEETQAPAAGSTGN